MAEPAIFITGPGKLLPGEEEKGAAALIELRQFVAQGRHETIPVMNALISLWLDLHLAALGLAETDRALRYLRRDLPHMVAALRAARGEPEGRA